jgi:2-C-methyl-D-erythritol 4-phosphate cytidylyltransferase
VFTSTLVARKVLEAFNRWKEGRNVYSGVSVTYSSDPCEKELVLVKETARPNLAKNFLKRSMR